MKTYYLIPQDKVSKIEVDSENRIVLGINAENLDEFLKEYADDVKMPAWFANLLDEAKGIFSEDGRIQCIKFICESARNTGHTIELKYAIYLFDVFVKDSA
jgi:hypothetical protein